MKNSDAGGIVLLNHGRIIYICDYFDRFLGERVHEFRGGKFEPFAGELALALGRRNTESLSKQEMTWETCHDEAGICVKRFVPNPDMSESELSDPSLVRAREIILASVTHELRTPLSGLIGASNLLMETSLASDQKNYVELIQKASEHALGIIDDILDLARIEAGEIGFLKEPVDIRGLIESTIEILGFKASDKRLTLDYVVETSVPKIIESDEKRLKQILFNVAGNAVKFTEDGGVLIHVTYDTGELKFSIIDTGPGISPTDQARLFIPFERGAAERSAVPGSGLGLAIVQRLVTGAGGTINVRSSLGKGAEFQITLPAPAQELMQEDAALSQMGCVILPANHLQGYALQRTIEQMNGRAKIINFKSLDEALSQENASVIASEIYMESIKDDFADRLSRFMIITHSKGNIKSEAAGGAFKWLTSPLRPTSLSKVLLAVSPGEPGLAVRIQTGAETLLKGMRILVAEDDPVNAKIIGFILRRHGAEVLIVENGKAALDIIGNPLLVVDCAIFDMKMPVMGGVEAARRVRAHDGPAGRVPIIGLTANQAEIERKMCVAAGMDAFITKPVIADFLVQSVCNLVATR
ncbi:ATP-binding protein [Hyphomonadaceae bacterium ML37]|nr:ATP-binding protein [Hyphomonadaceae bacterium ML37]